MEYEVVRERLLGFDGLESGAGATAEEIATAEGTLAVVFPDSYRRFVQDFGWAGIGGSEVFGLGADVPPYLDVVAVTLDERSQLRPGLPEHVLPVFNDGGGNLVCINCSDGSARMSFWDQETGEEEQLGVDFPEWLDQAIAEA